MPYWVMSNMQTLDTITDTHRQAHSLMIIYMYIANVSLSEMVIFEAFQKGPFLRKTLILVMII